MKLLMSKVSTILMVDLGEIEILQNEVGETTGSGLHI